VPTNAQSSPCLRLSVLGPFKAERDGTVIPDSAWQRPKARALVKLLAVQPGHRLHGEEILDLLWPDLSPQSALGSLRKATTLARQALEPDLPPRAPSSFLHVTDGVLSLDSVTVRVDADWFQARAEAALASTDEALYREALALYTDDLLPEDRYEDWTGNRRDALANLYLQILLALADLLEGRGAHSKAIETLQGVLRREPAQEDVHRRLMRLYVANGNRQGALRQFQTCRETLKSELGVEPERETVALHKEISTGRLSPTPPVPRGAASVMPVPLPAAIRRLPPTPLMGRQRPLDLVATELARLTDPAQDGAHVRRGVVLFGGEAGVGKTRLVAEAARSAHEAGTLALWGASYQVEGNAPYAPFVEALEDYLGTTSRAERQALAFSHPELIRLLPSLAAEGEPSHHAAGNKLEGESGRLQLFAVIMRLLENLSATRPLLLVLDDLHTADAATFQLLHHLARTAPDHPWLILGTYRQEDVEAGGAFEQLRTSLTRASLCRHVDLLRLSRTDCAALVRSLLPGGTPDDELLDRIYALSLGNPLFAQELVLSMREDLTLCEGRWTASTPVTTLPPQVRDLITERITRLPAATQHVLALAAAAGMESEYGVLRLASALEESDLLDALDSALGARILEERNEGFAFHHPLLRETLYERLSRTRRSHVHTLLGQAIEQHAPDAVDNLAYHFARSTDAEKAIAYLERAGDRARDVHAVEQAAALYAEVLERLKGREFAVDVAIRISEKLAKTLTTIGRYEEGLAVWERVATTHEEAGDIEGLARAMSQIALAHSAKGTQAEVLGRIESLLQRVAAAEPSAGLAHLHLALSNLYLASGKATEGLEAAERASNLARIVGDEYLLAGCEATRGTLLLMLGCMEQGKQVLEAVIPLAEKVQQLMALDTALNNLGVSYTLTSEYRQSAVYVRKSLAVAERMGSPVRTAFQLAQLGYILTKLGDWAEARDYLQRALQIARTLSSGRQLVVPFKNMGYLELVQGRWEEARSYLAEAIDLADRYGTPQDRHYAHVFSAELDLLEERPETALACLQPILHEPSTQVGDLPYAPATLAAWAHCELNDLQQGEELIARAVETARSEGKTWQLVHALGVQVRLLAARDEWERVAEVVDQAMVLARDASYPYGEAHLQWVYGTVLRERGDLQGGHDHLTEALALFRQLGVEGYAGRIERSLSELVAVS
jgi:DNA-binding SARP family transcriptional activator